MRVRASAAALGAFTYSVPTSPTGSRSRASTTPTLPGRPTPSRESRPISRAPSVWIFSTSFERAGGTVRWSTFGGARAKPYERGHAPAGDAHRLGEGAGSGIVAPIDA